MKLQVAFDTTTIEQALEQAVALQEYIDIVEIGSLLLYAYGTSAIERFREVLPQHQLLADMKIVDRGKEATQVALKAGADWVTVLAGTGKSVIHATCTTAHEARKRVMLDLIDASSPGQSALEATSLGVDALLFHKPADDEDPHLSFLERWDMVRENTKLPIFISVPVSAAHAQSIIELRPNGIVVSKPITDSSDPLTEIKRFRELIG